MTRASRVAGIDDPNRLARDRALAAVSDYPVDATGLVSYRSGGRLLVVAAAADTVERVLARAPPLKPTVLLTTEGRDLLPGVTTWHARREEIRLRGWLGSFRLCLDGEDAGEAVFDLVLDLSAQPLLDTELRPPGYQAPGGDADAVDAALAGLRELVGEFEKPRYFAYDPAICAHGMKGATACRRCIDACPAGAVSSLVDRVQVEQHLCQGGGACATACPTGALTYAYPSVEDSLGRLRRLLGAYREAGGAEAVLLVHDTEAGAQRVERLQGAGGLPGHVLPVPVEEVASLGLESWLTALAYGASAVRLVDTPALPASARREVCAQLGFAQEILSGLGYPADAVDWLGERAVGLATRMPPIEAAGHAAVGGKRQILFAALDHLHAEAQRPKPFVQLQAGAPFGTADLDQKACTLCMACVTVCPGKALQDGHDVPQLRFLEASCVQCGLCTRSCPEDAIWISPRLLFDAEARSRPRLLREEEPYHCVSCGTPFATTSVIGCMQQRLSGHSMFQDEKARRRLRMCGECRVADMMREEAGPL